MARAVQNYNRIARLLGQKPSASIDDIVRALGKDVTFAKIGNLKAGLFTPGQHAGTTKYWIQGNPTARYGARAARHELVHLGAALNGPADTILHEVAVQTVTTPEGGISIMVGCIVVHRGVVYWIEDK